MQHLVEIIKALAWPIAVIWIGYLFRSEIRSLIERMSKFKYKDIEADFSKTLSQVETESAKVRANQNESQPEPATISRLDQLRRIADVSPRAAIMEAWILVESAIGSTVPTSGNGISQSAVSAVVHNLVRVRKLPEGSEMLVNNLRYLRNQAAHLPDFALTTNEAERYLEAASNIAEFIKVSAGNA